MTDLQIELLNIYLEFKSVCKKLNIPFFAAGGTLLGAIRHKGFIPWDDDMDLYMFREDYERFLKEAPSLFSEDFFVQCHNTDKEWFRPFCKIRKNNTTAIEYFGAKFHQGIWIDVFPLDKYIDDNKLLKKDEKRRKQLIRRVSIHYGMENKIKGKIYNMYIILRYPSLKNAYKKICQLAIKYNNSKQAKYYSTIWDDKTKKKVFFDERLLKNFKSVPFENHSIYVPTYYDIILTIQYGDWHKIPPVNDRQPGHTIHLLDLQSDYKNYLERSKR